MRPVLTTLIILCRKCKKGDNSSFETYLSVVYKILFQIFDLSKTLQLNGARMQSNINTY